MYTGHTRGSTRRCVELSAVTVETCFIWRLLFVNIHEEERALRRSRYGWSRGNYERDLHRAAIAGTSPGRAGLEDRGSPGARQVGSVFDNYRAGRSGAVVRLSVDNGQQRHQYAALSTTTTLLLCKADRRRLAASADRHDPRLMRPGRPARRHGCRRRRRRGQSRWKWNTTTTRRARRYDNKCSRAGRGRT